MGVDKKLLKEKVESARVHVQGATENAKRGYERAFRVNESSWEVLQGLDDKDTVRYRDVAGEQELRRAEDKKAQKFTSRLIFTSVICVLIFVAMWLIVSFFEMLFYNLANGSSEGLSSFITLGMAHNDGTVLPYGAFLGFTFLKFILSLLVAGGFFVFLIMYLYRNLKAQNSIIEGWELNTWKNDQHIALPEELQASFDYFPDAGAHSEVSVSSLIAHMTFSNDGLKPFETVVRTCDDDDDYEFYAAIDGDRDALEIKKMPRFDLDFARALYDASGVPEAQQRYYNPSKIPYNPGNLNRERLSGYDTVADLMNSWTLPLYETTRPAGAYLVDTRPVNTMVLAITRAGKGQTIIEPTIDMWLRETNRQNMVVNDPKGELLVKNYVPAAVRGFHPIQFNLINALKTDIYNPLTLAVQSAIEGERVKVAQYVENIADVFFPLTGGEDPVWPNAASNAFKRVTYAIIDYYLEIDHQMRQEAAERKTDAGVLASNIDTMWGKVTLYNCYQMFVQMSADNRKRPTKTDLYTRICKNSFAEVMEKEEVLDKETGEIKTVDVTKTKFVTPEGTDFTQQEVEWLQKYFMHLERTVWGDNLGDEVDAQTLYFAATEKLPRNTVRELVMNAHNSLRSIAGAEKMLSSVYGIATTAMSFFADPTISTLTSGTPSQNVDLASLSFPRRFEIRFNTRYMEAMHLIGARCRWQAYADRNFTQSLGPDFFHEDLVSREGWARYYFKGIFETESAWIKCDILNSSTNVLIRTFYFKYTKSYQMSLDGKHFFKDPVLDEKIVKNGYLTEYVSDNGEFRPDRSKFRAESVEIKKGQVTCKLTDVEIIVTTDVRYSEKPKAIFLVTPPHLMKYSKIVLIALSQMTNLSFESSYLTKSNQKPLYKTRFMLDELGNLQSEGHGIANFETMLSIGLGQSQEFTLILQTMQQLENIYGNDTNKIISGNTANIVFLKSTDDEMIDTLVKMSGTKHTTRTSSKVVTEHVGRWFNRISDENNITVNVDQEPVISYNDLAFISERNSIVFVAGSSPVWNRNETILPMSWRLFKDNIKQPGANYSLQTIPTLSSAADFDVRKNQIDFYEMLNQRLEEAMFVSEATEMYKQALGLDNYSLPMLDQDMVADDIMKLTRQLIERQYNLDPIGKSAIRKWRILERGATTTIGAGAGAEEESDDGYEEAESLVSNASAVDGNVKIYGDAGDGRGCCVCKNDLVVNGLATYAVDRVIIEAFSKCKTEMMADTSNFLYKSGYGLYSPDGNTLYISEHSTTYRDIIQKKATKGDGRVFGDISAAFRNLPASAIMAPSDDFYKYLASQKDWKHIAGGAWDKSFGEVFRAIETGA